MTHTHRPGATSPPAASPAVIPHKLAARNGLLAAVTCLFLLLVWVVVVQARTIESQRNLIRTLFADSSELRALRNAQSSKSVPPEAPAKPQVVPPAAQAKPQVHRPERREMTPPPPPPRSVPADARRSADVT